MRWFVGLLTLFACKSDPPANAHWTGGKLVFEQLPRASGTAAVEGGDLVVRLDALPPKTRVKLGEQKDEPVNDAGHWTGKLDLVAGLGAVPIKDVEKGYGPPGKLTITLDRQAPVALDLPKILQPSDLERRFEDVTRGKPVRFDGEAAAQGKHAILVVKPWRPEDRAGDPKTFADVDWFAVIDAISDATGSFCKYTGGSVYLDIEQVTVAIYDRRAATKVAERTFKGKDECPISAKSRAGTLSARTEVRRDEVVAWLKERGASP